MYDFYNNINDECDDDKLKEALYDNNMKFDDEIKSNLTHKLAKYRKEQNLYIKAINSTNDGDNKGILIHNSYQILNLELLVKNIVNNDILKLYSDLNNKPITFIPINHIVNDDELKTWSYYNEFDIYHKQYCIIISRYLNKINKNVKNASNILISLLSNNTIEIDNESIIIEKFVFNNITVLSYFCQIVEKNIKEFKPINHNINTLIDSFKEKYCYNVVKFIKTIEHILSSCTMVKLIVYNNNNIQPFIIFIFAVDQNESYALFFVYRISEDDHSKFINAYNRKDEQDEILYFFNNESRQNVENNKKSIAYKFKQNSSESITHIMRREIAFIDNEPKSNELSNNKNVIDKSMYWDRILTTLNIYFMTYGYIKTEF